MGTAAYEFGATCIHSNGDRIATIFPGYALNMDLHNPSHLNFTAGYLGISAGGEFVGYLCQQHVKHPKALPTTHLPRTEGIRVSRRSKNV
jgi:hypothetical protein